MNSEVYSLEFDAQSFETHTITVKTARGEKTVVYRSYMHIPYVSKPVHTGYQSLNIQVPVSVDGVEVDVSNAPILILIGVGGYTSCPNDEKLFVGPPGMDGGPDEPKLGHHGARPEMPMPPMSGKPFGDTYDKAGTDSGPNALAKGWIVVIPGVRGHDNRWPNGTYFGKAPASIVDLKAVVRYLRHNSGAIGGDCEKIFASGGSAAGALAALMGTSGNKPWYQPYLDEIGAAQERDDVFGVLAFCPITDLSHADGAYEWQYGGLPAVSPFQPEPKQMDPQATEVMTTEFVQYMDQLGLQGKSGFGPINGQNLSDYILKEYLIPSCQRWFSQKADDELRKYLAQNPWISYADGRASFSFSNFVRHCGRSKTQPAFDDTGMNMEPAIFGTAAVNGRHFTDFGLRYATGVSDAKVEPEVVVLESMMNAMYFLPDRADKAKHWWIRHGTCDKDTSLPVIINLATALENAGCDVNARLVWDGGHGADDEKYEMIDWIASVTK